MNILKKIFTKRETILLIFIIIISIVIANLSEHFLTLGNLKGVFASISVSTIIAAGMTVLFISGGFDMSVGTHMGFLSIMFGIFLGNGIPIIYAIILILALGIIDGLIMGILVAKLGINPFITTLGTMFIFKGLAFLVGITTSLKAGASVASITDLPESLHGIAGGKFYGIEYINFYMIAILAIMYFLSTRNVFFRQSQFVGGNENASRLAGIKVNIVIIFNFVLVSALVAAAAILKVSRLQAASAKSGGQMLGLSIIAAVIIGGGSLKGGSGSIIGSFLGVTMIVLINNGMNLLKVDSFYSQVFVGSILLFSVIADEFTKKYMLRQRV